MIAIEALSSDGKIWRALCCNRHAVILVSAKNTTGSPLCFDEVYVSADGASALLTSRLFKPKEDRLRFREPDIVFGEDLETTGYKIGHICISSPTKPCNG